MKFFGSLVAVTLTSSSVLFVEGKRRAIDRDRPFLQVAHDKVNRLSKTLLASSRQADPETISDNIISIGGSATPTFFCQPPSYDSCKEAIQQQQQRIISQVMHKYPGAQLVAKADKLVNVVFVDLGSDMLMYNHSSDLSGIDGITSVSKHQTYSIQQVDYSLAATAEYAQAKKANQLYCTSGKGVKVAILDTGIDYTHESMGGPGTTSAYQKAYGKFARSKRNQRRDGLFPTNTVYDGYDFIGDDSSIRADDDPIDIAGGHGTFVASNVLAIAPDAKLLAVKVCFPALGCPDWALMMGVEYAMDPNGDGNVNDRVDIINFSLGSPFLSSFYDAVTMVLEAAFKLGTLSVVAYGNSGQRAFIAGAVANSPNLFGIAATEHPNTVGRVGVVARYSSRGPGSNFQLKPDISAPSGAAAAVAGSGNGYRVAFGTSFSAPIMAGAAALLLERCPQCSPFAIKAILMNTADRNVLDYFTGESAPLSSGGSGEVRIAAALEADFWAYSPDQGDMQPSISLGLINVAENMVISRKIRIVGLINQAETIRPTAIFRNPQDGESRALEVIFVQASVVTRCNADVEIDVLFKINAANVPNNFLDFGRNPYTKLNKNEFDGHIVLASATKSIQIPFHAILRKAARLQVSQDQLPQGNEAYELDLRITNTGAGVAQIDSYQLLGGLDPDEAEAMYGDSRAPSDFRAVGYRTVPSTTIGCKRTVEFAVNLWERPVHIVPTFVYAYIYRNSGDLAAGPDVALVTSLIDDLAELKVLNLKTEKTSCTGFFLEHSVGSGNIILRACGEQLGLKEGQPFSAYFSTGTRPNTVFSDFAGPFEMHYPRPLISASSYDIKSGETFNKLRVTNRNTNPQSLPAGIMLVTNAYRTVNNTGASVKEQEAIVLLREGLQKFEEVTPDILVYPQSNSFVGPLCLWRGNVCSTTFPANAPQPNSAYSTLTEYPTSSPAPTSRISPTRETEDPSCPPIVVPRLKVPTSSPSTSPPTTPPTTSLPMRLCYSGTTKVQVKDRGTILMADLRIGDSVLVDNNLYEKVYSFGHRHESAAGMFLHLSPSGLELSKDHMVKLGSRYVPASSLQVGDLLENSSGEMTAIVEISEVLREGVYAPFTVSGTIVVNNVKASSYIALQGSANLSIGNWETPFSFQWIAHTSQMPHRLYRRWFVSSAERYTDDGVSTWLDLSCKYGQWILLQHPLITALLLTPLLVFLLAMSLLELFFLWDQWPRIFFL